MAKKKIEAHKFDREQNDHYVEPYWPTSRLLDVERFEGPILDPACGWGRILQAAGGAGYDTIGSDIVDRHDRGTPSYEFRRLNFLAPHDETTYDWWRQANSIVVNPPFDLFQEFVARATAMMFNAREGGHRVAFIWQTRRLNAASWLLRYPLRRILYMTPRPSMPTGEFIHRALRG